MSEFAPFTLNKIIPATDTSKNTTDNMEYCGYKKQKTCQNVANSPIILSK